MSNEGAKRFLEGDIVRVKLFPDLIIEAILRDVSTDPYIIQVLSWPEDNGYYSVWDKKILTLHACVWSPSEMSYRELRWRQEQKELIESVARIAGWLELGLAPE